MDKRAMIDILPFGFLLKHFVFYYEREYGQVAAQDVFKKVYTSNKANRFIHDTLIKGVRPGTEDFMMIIISSSHFTFAKAEKRSFAAIILLSFWNEKVGIPGGLSNDYFLNSVFFSILSKSDAQKIHVSAQPNFFERLYAFLELSYTEYINKLVSEEEEKSEEESQILEIDGYSTLPEELHKKLDGLTIDEAWQAEIIDDIGNDNGDFVFSYIDQDSQEDRYYALVQGCAVVIPEEVYTHSDVNEIVGQLTFVRGIYGMELHLPS